MASVSVCIVTYNSEQYIGSCLDAVMKQSYPIEAIVVVDNASRDGSVPIVQQRLQQGAPIQLIENRDNNGFAGGQNQAIEAVKSDYVLALNPDVVLDVDYVSQLVEVMEANPHYGSATGLLVRQADASLVDSTGLVMKRTRQCVDRGSEQKVTDWLEPAEVFGVSGAAALYSRRMIEDIKLDGQFFDEEFFAYKEDVDVAWRGKLLGWSAFYTPKAKAIHARGWQRGGRSHISTFTRQHSYQNQLFMIIKNEQPSWRLLIDLPCILAFELSKLAYILLRERDVLVSWKQMIRLTPVMLHKRKLLKKKLQHKKGTAEQ